MSSKQLYVFSRCLNQEREEAVWLVGGVVTREAQTRSSKVD